ncbi:hypothetical protein MYCTH_2300745 [Thermothelomyces thermophilus ATCC 42464]|uniref:Ribose-phosphate pyrophosphokinase N-terminal domain-containing protein n=1 Tax=Thermothelomyces thermophilus (strain ATCC 42464 / BCRC 31852 / DSM 1799) TaxID=573729 RepID=G2Q857_THET4|nr:uncharacterized protein MYCTH_2300745 [Thermothelomyces thermophilus ATCC 42464]AEO56160.1 hypothetical protein MYCTH_2300745 [Thermothelomyces thermophilus ATCC 42464]
MVRNLVLLSGSSHPTFVDRVASVLGIAPSSRVLGKFASGETRCEIRDSVRGKDVYIVQSFGVGGHTVPARGVTGYDDGWAEGEGVDNSGGGASNGEGKHTVNDYFIELCIMISACKTGSAKRVTAVLPLFPYSRQPDLPFSRVGAPQRDGKGKLEVAERGSYTELDHENPSSSSTTTMMMMMMALQAKPGHEHVTAHVGSLAADLLTCAGADRILTCDLHEKAYQGFFDIPGTSVDTTA